MSLTKEEQEVWDEYGKDEGTSKFTRENFLQSTVQRRRDGEIKLAEAEKQLLVLKENHRNDEFTQWLWGAALGVVGVCAILFTMKVVAG